MNIIPKSQTIAEIRIKLGLSRAALSKKAGISKVSVIHVEKGQCPTPRIARAITDALEVEFDEIFEIARN